VVAGLVFLPSVAAATPRSPAGPVQEHPGDDDGRGVAEAVSRALVGVETSLGSGDASAAGEALDRIEANVEQQLAQLESAEAAVAAAVKNLADKDAALGETQRRIEQLTAQMDDVTIGAFIDPPSLAAF
jgi:ABC-type transporter Mla subunit MlaD